MSADYLLPVFIEFTSKFIPDASSKVEIHKVMFTHPLSESNLLLKIQKIPVSWNAADRILSMPFEYIEVARKSFHLFRPFKSYLRDIYILDYDSKVTYLHIDMVLSCNLFKKIRMYRKDKFVWFDPLNYKKLLKRSLGMITQQYKIPIELERIIQSFLFTV